LFLYEQINDDDDDEVNMMTMMTMMTMIMMVVMTQTRPVSRNVVWGVEMVHFDAFWSTF